MVLLSLFWHLACGISSHQATQVNTVDVQCIFAIATGVSDVLAS